MAYTSQFTIYGSFDPYHPVLNGTSGSLLNLLNACLITGYGSKSGVGWSKTGSVGPAAGVAIPDSGSCGIFVQPTGSNATLFLADNALGTTSGTRNARATGYDSVQNFTASSVTVVGTNFFPLAAQGIISTITAVGIKKSPTADTTEVSWILFADSSSMYLFTMTTTAYQGFMFGDIYSIKSGSNDASKCMIVGGTEDGTGVNPGQWQMDFLTTPNIASLGHGLQRSYTGVGNAVSVGKHGDANKGSATVLLGITQYPNSIDNGLYLSPVWVHENASSTIRGRMRGFWHVLHPISNFSNGQIFTGTNGIFAGKTFMMVKPSTNSGIYCIETSATVETN